MSDQRTQYEAFLERKVETLKAENERLRAVLDLIRRGHSDPASIATDALDPVWRR